MKNLYLHVGPHKTGTTAIQNFLYRNRDGLRDNNVVYPIPFKDSPNKINHNDIAAAMRDENISKLLEILDIIDDQSDGKDNLILSGEEFSSIGNAGITKCIESYINTRYNLKIIFVDRDRNDRYISSLLHMLADKTNNVLSFKNSAAYSKSSFDYYDRQRSYFESMDACFICYSDILSSGISKGFLKNIFGFHLDVEEPKVNTSGDHVRKIMMKDSITRKKVSEFLGSGDIYDIFEKFDQEFDMIERIFRKTIKNSVFSEPKDLDGIYRKSGFCPICNLSTNFSSNNPWYRDHLLCSGCGSIPRERALALVLERRFPGWRQMKIHESSPAERGISVKLRQDCPGYVASQFFPNEPLGVTLRGFQNENLEAQTFTESSFDLVVTLDVMEHVNMPDRVMKEIARTLKPGGSYLFTVPTYKGRIESERRSQYHEDGTIQHFAEPEYHGNPVSDAGSLVTFHYGYDLAEKIHEWSGMDVEVLRFHDHHHGIIGDFTEVYIATLRE